jgi:hypothetical protein
VQSGLLTQFAAASSSLQEGAEVEHSALFFGPGRPACRDTCAISLDEKTLLYLPDFASGQLSSRDPGFSTLCDGAVDFFCVDIARFTDPKSDVQADPPRRACGRHDARILRDDQF